MFFFFACHGNEADDNVATSNTADLWPTKSAQKTSLHVGHMPDLVIKTQFIE